jgi:glycerophosphoryl diester phosphodiesterase
MVRRAGAVPIFFLTWAHQDGWPDYGLPGYSAMQDAIDAGYLFIAAEQHAPVAPVGFAWSALDAAESHRDLWQGDGSHPTTKGTYLAACVFYAAIFKARSAGLSYHPWLFFSDDAAQAQSAADTTVLGDLARWGLA